MVVVGMRGEFGPNVRGSGSGHCPVPVGTIFTPGTYTSRGLVVGSRTPVTTPGTDLLLPHSGSPVCVGTVSVRIQCLCTCVCVVFIRVVSVRRVSYLYVHSVCVCVRVVSVCVVPVCARCVCVWCLYVRCLCTWCCVCTVCAYSVYTFSTFMEVVSLRSVCADVRSV